MIYTPQKPDATVRSYGVRLAKERGLTKLHNATVGAPNRKNTWSRILFYTINTRMRKQCREHHQVDCSSTVVANNVLLLPSNSGEELSCVLMLYRMVAWVSWGWTICSSLIHHWRELWVAGWHAHTATTAPVDKKISALDYFYYQFGRRIMWSYLAISGPISSTIWVTFQEIKVVIDTHYTQGSLSQTTYYENSAP